MWDGGTSGYYIFGVPIQKNLQSNFGKIFVVRGGYLHLTSLILGLTHAIFVTFITQII
jgi:hypothetical protein